MKPVKQNIALIGMPAAGKSSLGKRLAHSLGWSFCDTDNLIEQSAGLGLQQIVDQRGYEALRAIEAQVIISLELSGSVIATGGSAVYSERAMLRLRELATIVYLRCEFDELVSRLGDYSVRGLARPPGQSLSDLYTERSALYEQFADLTFDTSRMDLATAADELTSRLKRQV